ncbi:PREDICTED: uncharacterized protein LOC105121201 [Populus euphratica]|uniref:Uncharacterized protein LOC105121201 n=1 Tax=Populus euphratica TaxID=75702 RepID=A0AAJ6XGU6_POPEU|nr:PREDICTED: uncharacterized protein LOC105121201 [Populus euphratica]
MVAEKVLFLEPFDKRLFQTCMSACSSYRYYDDMIQLIEFLISGYLLTWLRDEGFDCAVFEEWVISFLHARKVLALLESRKGLHVSYLDRVTGELAKHVGQVSTFQELSQDILDKLFCRLNHAFIQMPVFPV